MKSEKALSFVDSVKEQVAPLPELLEGELSATIHIWYRTQRPDLDESIILDALEGLVYKNDRQVREKHVYHAIDKEHPRVRVILTPRVALPSEEPFSWMRQLADAAPPPDSPGSPSGA
jgi:Holliday junction resolvase RusA-like endonuclease